MNDSISYLTALQKLKEYADSVPVEDVDDVSHIDVITSINVVAILFGRNSMQVLSDYTRILRSSGEILSVELLSPVPDVISVSSGDLHAFRLETMAEFDREPLEDYHDEQ